ncbi:MAG: hypothetical protein A3G91_06370 [Omnitrophica WOR_2 bacterium RIFCSPLOWO2_12_FULL_50_9]|nr:MAG: hypothetical protein A3G91_06370 [Omnitrophica WOR_2 bacterium RIFCSPLOWO2_12_FULL_50_9]
MRITFVALGMEQMGVSLLSAIAKREGHKVSLAFSPALFNDRSHLNVPFLAPFFDDRRDVMEVIRKQMPDVLVFSPLTATYQWMLRVAEEAKKILPAVKVLFGGVHTSAVPDRVLERPYIDYICVGEGDVAFAMILRSIERAEAGAPIPNTRYRRKDGRIIAGPQTGFVQNLDALPIFDKTLWEEHIPLGDSYITMTARGCPYRCTFCFNNFFAQLPQESGGKYVRRRSVGHMMYELRLAKRRYKLNMIEFFDDVFTLDKKWLKGFLDYYRNEIAVPFQCFTHVNYVDEDIGRWLSEAGCFSTQIGVQSLDDEYKRKQVQRHERVCDIERTIKVMKKYKIRVKFDHMFALPGENIEAQETARRFYAALPPDNIQTYWTNYFPGTELIQQGLAQGLITEEDVARINEGLDCDIYSHSNCNVDRGKIKAYHIYQIIFKLIPHVPPAIRQRLHPRLFAWLPARVCAWISLLADIFIGLIKFSPDHILYARYYLYHIRRFLLKRLGIRARPATRVTDTRPWAIDVPQASLVKEEICAAGSM